MSVYNPIKVENHEIDMFCSIVGIPHRAVSKYVGCLDRLEKNGETLLLFHYNPDKVDELISTTGDFTDNEIKKILSCRGYIICVESGKIECRSYGCI